MAFELTLRVCLSRTKRCISSKPLVFEQNVSFQTKRSLSNKALAFEQNVALQTKRWLSNKTLAFEQVAVGESAEAAS